MFGLFAAISITCFVGAKIKNYLNNDFKDLNKDLSRWEDARKADLEHQKFWGKEKEYKKTVFKDFVSYDPKTKGKHKYHYYFSKFGTKRDKFNEDILENPEKQSDRNFNTRMRYFSVYRMFNWPTTVKGYIPKYNTRNTSKKKDSFD